MSQPHQAHLEESPPSDHINSEELDMVSYADCGVFLDNIHDLQRHLKSWCPAKNQELEAVSFSRDLQNGKRQWTPWLESNVVLQANHIPW